MHRHETDSYDRLCREVERRQWWATWGPVVRSALLAMALAAGMWAAVLMGDCGDVAADPEPEPAPHPSASQRTPAAPDAEAFALAARMRAWQPLRVERVPGELDAVAVAIVTACRADPWPTPERCPDLTAAIAFRESSWDVNAVGARGERGLMQLHGIALAGEGREAAMDAAVNVRLGLAHLRRAQVMCRFVGRGDVSTALGAYGSGRCRSYRGSRLVERWEQELRAGGAL